jgi:hypothetical protein
LPLSVSQPPHILLVNLTTLATTPLCHFVLVASIVKDLESTTPSSRALGEDNAGPKSILQSVMVRTLPKSTLPTDLVLIASVSVEVVGPVPQVALHVCLQEQYPLTANQDSTPSVMRGMMRSNLKVLPLGLLLALHRSQVVRDLRTVTIQACQRDLIVTGPDTLRATTMSMITFMITTSLAGMAKTRMTRIKTGETVMARMTTRERMARDMETSLTEHRLQASFCTLGHLH